MTKIVALIIIHQHQQTETQSIEMGLKQIWYEGIDWIQLAQARL
jgi:hypothetical protein